MGLVEKRRARPDASAPASTEALSSSVTLTPEARFERSVAPSAWVIRTIGIVMLLSVPPSPAGGLSETLSATRTAMAPALWQFRALTTKVQVPRSTSAKLPATAAALVRGEQASVVAAPTLSEGSAGATRQAGRAAAVNCPPNDTVPAA